MRHPLPEKPLNPSWQNADRSPCGGRHPCLQTARCYRSAQSKSTLFESCSCPIYSGSAKNLRRTPTRPQDTRRAFVAISLPQESPPPGRFSCNRDHAFPKDGSTIAPADRQDRNIARHRFRRCIVPGTTRQHAHEQRTALPSPRLPDFRLPPAIAELLLAALSQTSAFEPPGRPSQAPGHHPGCRSPSQVSSGLRIIGHVARGCYPSGSRRMSQAPAQA